MSYSEDNLIPCDKCGKTNVNFYAKLVDEDECYFHFMHYCSAINCYINSGWFDTKQDAINSWNYRANKRKENNDC